MAENRGVAYMGTGKVELQDIDFPTFELKDGPGVNPANVGRSLPHAAILKIVSTNICAGCSTARASIGWTCRSRRPRRSGPVWT